MTIKSVEKNRLLANLQKEGYLTSERIKAAMKCIPRELFVPDKYRDMAYLDTPLDIGYGQTISAPHMIAIILDALNLEDNSKVLEIGTGTGYHAALTATIANLGTIFTVERIPQLAMQAKKNFSTLKLSNIIVTIDDGSMGLPRYSPFTRIYATCMAPKIPDALIEQLADKGRMVIPIGGTYCTLVSIEKHGSNISKKSLCRCSFVPMIGKGGYRED